jgi:hypothetical protein
LAWLKISHHGHKHDHGQIDIEAPRMADLRLSAKSSCADNESDIEE